MNENGTYNLSEEKKQVENFILNLQFEGLLRISNLVLKLDDKNYKKKFFNNFFEEFREIFVNELKEDFDLINFEINKEFFYISGFLEFKHPIKNKFFYFSIDDLREFEFNKIKFKRVQYIGDYFLNSTSEDVEFLKYKEYLENKLK